MRPDVADFYDGLLFDAYRLLGAHPAGPGRGWLFTVWAPHARRVQVLGDWNGWDLYHAAELAFCEDGLWRGRVPEARSGQLYKYNLQGPDGRWHLRPDPYAFDAEPLPGTASRLFRPQADFTAPARRGVGPDDPIRIYEMHATSWRRHWDGRYYTGPELARDLVPYLQAHAFTHVELMPLAEYPFDGSWGYQGCGYFCPTRRLGGFAGLTALVEALHRAGIGVLMDFVPVHFAADEGRLARFDGAPLYESGPSDWGSLNFDLSCGPVRSFLLSSAAFWLQVCGCDGLRVDAIGNALYHCGNGWQAAEFFKTLTAGLHARFPGVMLVAEDTAGAMNATAPTQDGGLGFDYVWDIGWTRGTLAYLAAPFDRRPQLFDRWLSVLEMPPHTRGMNALSHDDNAPGTGAIYEQLFGSEEQKLAQLRLLLLLQAARPGKTLLFSGTEFAQPHAFHPGREPDWAAAAAAPRRDLDAFCAALNRFAGDHPALFCGEYRPGALCRAGQDAGCGVFGFVRRGEGETLLCAFNTGAGAVSGFSFVVGGSGQALPRFAAGPLGDAPVPVREGRVRLDLPGLSGGIWEIRGTP